MGALELIISVVTGAIGSILAVEWILSVEPVCNYLVRRAVRQLPADHREHYESEWLQVVKDIKSPTWKVVHSVSLRLRACSIARTLGAPVTGLTAKTILIRALDLAISVLAVLPWLPLMALIALWIKFQTGGPVFIRQTRIGKGGKLFHVFKFSVCTRTDAARATGFALFLRRTSLDELPQLINVLLGHMSVVGFKTRTPDSNPTSNETTDRHPGLVPPVEDEQGGMSLRVWLKSLLWDAARPWR